MDIIWLASDKFNMGCLAAYGEVKTAAEAFHSPEATERKVLTRIPHSKVGWRPNVNLPIRFSETPMVDPIPAPAVGQHNIDVLQNVLGYYAKHIQKIQYSGALGC